MSGRETTDVVTAALSWRDTPYRHQASLKGAGCDCLGLVRGVWREVIGPEPVHIPAYRADWRDRTNAATLLRAAQALLIERSGTPKTGDVILFRLHPSLPPKHCGILVDDCVFVHAQEQIGVVEANLTTAWRRRVAGVFQFPLMV